MWNKITSSNCFLFVSGFLNCISMLLFTIWHLPELIAVRTFWNIDDTRSNIKMFIWYYATCGNSCGPSSMCLTDIPFCIYTTFYESCVFLTTPATNIEQMMVLHAKLLNLHLVIRNTCGVFKIVLYIIASLHEPSLRSGSFAASHSFSHKL